MARAVLVLLSRPETATWLLSAAHCLAELIGSADIQVLAVRAPPSPPPLLSVEVAMRKGAPETEKQEQQRCEAVRSAFDGWLRTKPELKASTHWQDVEGLIDAVVLERGRQADMIVLEQARRDNDVPQRVTIRRALLKGGRPVLVMPHGPCTVFGRRVAILWRDDEPSTKALLAAVPLLAQADTVDVIVGLRHGRPATLPPILAEQAIAARLHNISLSAGSFAGAALATNPVHK